LLICRSEGNNQGDIYVHADIHGAASVVIKNKKAVGSSGNCELNPVPPSTLSQAGCMSICNSKAWDAKVVTSAWWVFHDQVSKTAPSGEYLPTGSFMVRGRKNFLPHNQLVYGFGLMFKLHDDCVVHHVDDRKLKINLEELQNEADLPKKHEINPSEGMQANSVIPDEFESEFPDTQVEIDPIIMESKKYIENSMKLLESDRKNSELGYPSKKGSDLSRAQTNKKEETPEKSGPKGPARGKKGKLKKQMKKYANQDEEERQLKMELLGSKGSAKASPKTEKKEKSERKGRSPSTSASTPRIDALEKATSSVSLDDAAANRNDPQMELKLNMVEAKESGDHHQMEMDSDSESEAAKKIDILMDEVICI
jgi:hypothetical protein